MSYNKECFICKNIFITTQPITRFCSNICRNTYQTKLTGRYADKTISSATVGAISEMEVSSDLMKKGFAVFRALSPSCFCDLIACKNGYILRIEVTTGYQAENNRLSHAKKHNIDKLDIIAIYVRNISKIFYELSPTLHKEIKELFNKNNE